MLPREMLSKLVMIDSMVALGSVPLVRRNLFADRRRLVRSVAGIAFAVLLMMSQLGFRNAYVDSMLLVIDRLDGEIMLISSQKYEFDRDAPFSWRQLYQARGVKGVATARPLYMEKAASIWKNPQNHKRFAIMTFAFDPDQPVFLIPEVADHLADLRQPDTLMVDRRSRSDLGRAEAGTETEFSRQRVMVVGTFQLGPNFFGHGNAIMSDRNFFKLLGGSGADRQQLPDVEVGVVKVKPGSSVSAVQRALRAELPPNISVLTRNQLKEQEVDLQEKLSPVGPIFAAGTLVGFAVGILITYQILISELSDLLPQYATLRAMGYQTSYLVKLVLQQAMFYALLGYIPAWIITTLLFALIFEFIPVPIHMSLALTATTLALTVAMCATAGLISIRRVVSTDPAEVF
jgi:putative ABC transport system permease protein